MKNNNKGFIAISLIYSFFLVFLITLLAIVSDYAKNRILLNDVKKETQEYLNGLAEFNPVNIENKEYAVGEELIFGSDRWQVIEDDGENVSLVLARNLREDEIVTISEKLEIQNVNQEDKTLMCLKSYDPIICNYESSIAYNYYTWNNSVVKKIVEEWFTTNASLQKAISIGTLQIMDYSDGVRDYSNYIRIPLAAEFIVIHDADIWHLTSDLKENGFSYLKYEEELISAHENYKKIRPVIKIKKTI